MMRRRSAAGLHSSWCSCGRCRAAHPRHSLEITRYLTAAALVGGWLAIIAFVAGAGG